MKDVRLHRNVKAIPTSYARATNIRDFNCAETGVTSLVGSPKTVARDYWCWHTGITSLKGAPTTVGRNFDCASTRITTLEGAPKHIGGHLNCCLTPLVSLRGAPREIGGDFEINDTPLESLDCAPTEIGGRLCCWRTRIGLDELLVYLTKARVREVVSDFEFDFGEFMRRNNHGRVRMLFEN